MKVVLYLVVYHEQCFKILLTHSILNILHIYNTNKGSVNYQCQVIITYLILNPLTLHTDFITSNNNNSNNNKYKLINYIWKHEKGRNTY